MTNEDIAEHYKFIKVMTYRKCTGERNEDIVHYVLEYIMKYKHYYNPEKCSMMTFFIMQIKSAVYLYFKIKRSQKSEHDTFSMQLLDEDEQEKLVSPNEQLVEDLVDWGNLYKYIDKADLTNLEYSDLYQVYFMGKGPTELGAERGVTKNAVITTINRALNKLRKVYGVNCNEQSN